MSFAHGPGQIHSRDFMAVPPRRHMAFSASIHSKTNRERKVSFPVCSIKDVICFALCFGSVGFVVLLLILLILLALLLIVFRFLHEWSSKISGEEISNPSIQVWPFR
ncbi:MAG: hypothetical protein ACLRXC_12915 [[Clostridium] leptum]